MNPSFRQEAGLPRPKWGSESSGGEAKSTPIDPGKGHQGEPRTLWHVHWLGITWQNKEVLSEFTYNPNSRHTVTYVTHNYAP